MASPTINQTTTTTNDWVPPDPEPPYVQQQQCGECQPAEETLSEMSPSGTASCSDTSGPRELSDSSDCPSGSTNDCSTGVNVSPGSANYRAELQMTGTMP